MSVSMMSPVLLLMYGEPSVSTFTESCHNISIKQEIENVKDPYEKECAKDDLQGKVYGQLKINWSTCETRKKQLKT